MNIIRIIKLLENSSVLIEGVTETIKHETKIQENRFCSPLLVPMAALSIAPMVSLLVWSIF